MLTCSVINPSAIDRNSPTYDHNSTLEHRNNTQFHNFSLQTVEDSSVGPTRNDQPNLDNTNNSENTEGNNSLHLKRDSKCILF